MKVFINMSWKFMEGEMAITFTNLDEETFYSKAMTALVELEINETMDADKGFGKLIYDSNNGIGN